jgi:hypothetical protein
VTVTSSLSSEGLESSEGSAAGVTSAA